MLLILASGNMNRLETRGRSIRNKDKNKKEQK